VFVKGCGNKESVGKLGRSPSILGLPYKLLRGGSPW
jgi:hypothetical protein